MKYIILLNFLFCFSVDATENHKYRIWVKDASHLKEGSDHNEWMKKFYNDVLYQGFVGRLSPLIFSMGAENQNAWQGRLIDYLFDRIINGHPMSLSYFSIAQEASPMGITIYNLSEAESTMLKGIVEVFGSKSSESIVNKLIFRNNTIGIAFHQDCVSISRSSIITEILAKEDCTNFKPKGDAVLQLKTKEMFSSFHPLLENFVGINGDIDLVFSWNKSLKKYEPDQTEIPLKQVNIFKKGVIPFELLQSIPSTAGMWGLVNITNMNSLDTSSIKNYFLNNGQSKIVNTTSVVYAFLGMESKTRISKTALLIYHNETLTTKNQLAQLFNENSRYDIKFRFVCKNVLAFSPSIEALKEMEDSCNKKRPSFNQWSKSYNESLKNMISSVTFLNLGTLTSQALKVGSVEEIQNTDEYKSSYQLLTELPHFLWVGTASDNNLEMKGVTQ